jgi:hypothetical protein
VNSGVLRLISPYIRVRLESALAGYAVHAAPAIDDASRTTVHTILLIYPSCTVSYPTAYTLHPDFEA